MSEVETTTCRDDDPRPLCSHCGQCINLPAELGIARPATGQILHAACDLWLYPNDAAVREAIAVTNEATVRQGLDVVIDQLDDLKNADMETAHRLADRLVLHALVLLAGESYRREVLRLIEQYDGISKWYA